MISYILLGGRCRYCGEKISPRYPIVEVLTAVIFTALYFKFGIVPGYFLSALMAALMIVISFIDIEHMEIYDVLVIAGIAVGLAYSAIDGMFVSGLQGICFGFIFMLLVGSAAGFIFKKDALGDGDIKFMVMLGSFLGIEGSIWAIAVASIAGSVVGAALILSGSIRRQDYIPFAPFLALGALISVFM